MTIDECQMMESLCEIFFITDKTHYSMFDIHYSIFNIRFFINALSLAALTP